MTERTLPGIGLTGFWDQGAPWKIGGDQNWLLSSVLTQLTVESATTSLPASPLNGVIYIVPVGDPNANQVAARDNGAWAYFAPQEGWTAYVRDAGILMNFDGTDWAPSTKHLSDALAASGGAGQVGYGATTVAAALTSADEALHRSGGVNTPNSTFNLNINSMAADAAASSVGGGTLQQPNKVGWQVARSYTNPGVGTQTVFPLTAAFPITLVPGVEVVRVALIRRIDRVRIPQVVTTDYTISGSGTSNIDITFNSAVDLAVYDVWIRGIGSAQSGNAPLLNFVDHGYDSVTDGAGPQVVVLGAHHTDLGNAGGHNTFVGGSYNEAINGSNYSVIGGTNNTANALQQGGVLGANNIAGGGGTFVFGQRNQVTGDLSVAFGDFHSSALTGVAHFGRGSVARASGHVVTGNYKSGDTTPGLRQFGSMGLSKTTTDATEGFLSAMNGTSLIVPGDTTHVLVIANVIAVSSDGATCAEFTGRVILKRSGGTATIVGTAALTLGANTGALSAATMRFQAASNGLYLRPTGIAATTVRWMAEVKWIETSWAAA